MARQAAQRLRRQLRNKVAESFGIFEADAPSDLCADRLPRWSRIPGPVVDASRKSKKGLRLLLAEELPELCQRNISQVAHCLHSFTEGYS